MFFFTGQQQVISHHFKQDKTITLLESTAQMSVVSTNKPAQSDCLNADKVNVLFLLQKDQYGSRYRKHSVS